MNQERETLEHAGRHCVGQKREREKEAPYIHNGRGSGNDFRLYSNNVLSLEEPLGAERELAPAFLGFLKLSTY